MTVEPARAAGSYAYAGETYYFCAKSCLEKFRADPAKYLNRPAPGLVSLGAKPVAPPQTAPAATEAIYTCPMHPEVRQRGPGACPKCGMALEPVTLTLADTANPELIDMSRRFWISVVLTAPVLILAMAELLDAATRTWLEMALATPVVLWCGWPLFARGIASVRNRSLNMFTLIALGTGAAYFYSLAAGLFPSFFPDSFRGMDGQLPVYFEPAAVITTLVLLGQVLELRARGQTASAIRALLKLAPLTAHRLHADGADEDVPLEQVHPGDRLRVRPGEKTPVDGLVIEGASAVDESMIT